MSVFVTRKFPTSLRATVGADFTTREIQVGGKTLSLQLWDTAGQERFQSLGVAFYRGADACVLVYDVTKPKTFESLSNWRDEFLVQAGPRDPANFPFVVLANKCDRPPAERLVKEQEALAWCAEGRTRPIPHFDTSAKEGINIDQAFQCVCTLALAQESVRDEPFMPPPLRVNERPKPEDESCANC